MVCGYYTNYNGTTSYQCRSGNDGNATAVALGVLGLILVTVILVGCAACVFKERKPGQYSIQQPIQQPAPKSKNKSNNKSQNKLGPPEDPPAYAENDISLSREEEWLYSNPVGFNNGVDCTHTGGPSLEWTESPSTAHMKQ